MGWPGRCNKKDRRTLVGLGITCKFIPLAQSQMCFWLVTQSLFSLEEQTVRQFYRRKHRVVFWKEIVWLLSNCKDHGVLWNQRLIIWKVWYWGLETVQRKVDMCCCERKNGPVMMWDARKNCVTRKRSFCCVPLNKSLVFLIIFVRRNELGAGERFLKDPVTYWAWKLKFSLIMYTMLSFRDSNFTSFKIMTVTWNTLNKLS